MLDLQREPQSRDEVNMEASEVTVADQPRSNNILTRKKMIWFLILAVIVTGVIFIGFLKYVVSLREDINYYKIKISILEEIYGYSPQVNQTDIRQKAHEFTSISGQNCDPTVNARYDKLLAQKKDLQQSVKKMWAKNQELLDRVMNLQKDQAELNKYGKQKIPSMMGPSTLNTPIEIIDLIHEIEIKRRNENSLRRFLNFTYIPFELGDHYYDPKLYELLSTYYKQKKVKSLVDLGCGRCEYITQLNQTGIQAVGFDGQPYSKNPIIQQKDLSKVLHLSKQYDYVQSFEVGEHIFSDFQSNFLYNIANHAKMGIVMSWAEIGQVGSMHLNNRNSDYIIGNIERFGFQFNKNDTMWFRTQLTKHFAKTILVFQRK